MKKTIHLFTLFTLFVALLCNQVSWGADSASINPPAVKVTAKSTGGVPVGTIVAWPTASQPEDPENWLDCNGQGIAQGTYPELFAVVGNHVPNLQGMFLRGFGTQSHTQNNGQIIGNTMTAHSSGNLGQVQGDATRNIEGEFEFKPRVHGSIPPRGAFSALGTTGSSEDGGPDRASHMKLSTGYVTPTANENRPANVAVRYLIRALP